MKVKLRMTRQCVERGDRCLFQMQVLSTGYFIQNTSGISVLPPSSHGIDNIAILVDQSIGTIDTVHTFDLLCCKRACFSSSPYLITLT